MAFSFASTGQNGMSLGGGSASNNGQARMGPDLQEISTEGLGFLGLAGEAKVQLLASPWPADNLPPPTASLLSVASRRGLLAAAGPDGVIVATTDSVRKSFETPKNGDTEIRVFQPQMTIPMSMRVSQLAFTADENFLLLSAEQGGGLAVYEVQNILNGSTKSAFEMSTEGVSLRAIAPNPTPEKGELLAVVTTDGKLMMANLKEKTFVSGSNGPVLKTGVSCLSWSARGKQLVAGLGDGTAYQMTPEGVGKADVPRPPNVDSNHHVSSITWLENNIFLEVHTPSNFDSSTAPQSVFNLVTRQPNSGEFVFQKLTDPAGPFGLNRSPPHHFMLRLRDFPPNLEDLLVISSTASTDIGLFSKSKTPLVSDKPAESITGVFTMTEMADDSRRAQLPMTEDMRDTSPIGMVIDLSSKEKVVKPIPSDEMNESPTPLPSLMVLNNEGILAAWWIVYSESIRQGTIFSGLVAAGNNSQPTLTPAPPVSQPSIFGAAASSQPSNQPTLGSTPNSVSAFGSFSKPAAPAFGTSSMGTSSGAAFGGPSALGKQASVWGTPAGGSSTSSGHTFGTPAFGSSTAPSSQNLAFGSSAALGSKTSPWTTGGTKTTGAAFGQPGGAGMGGGSVFGTSSSTPVFGSGSTGGQQPFAAFKDTGGFGGLAANQSSGPSIFATKSATSTFGAGSEPSLNAGSTFGGLSSASTAKPGGLFGSNGFTLGSTFKPDGSAKDDGPKPDNISNSFFGSTFGSALSTAPAATEVASPEADMDADEPEPAQEAALEDNKPAPETMKNPSSQATVSTTPASTPAPAKFQFSSATSASGNLFGSSATKATPLMAPAETKSVGFKFGTPATSLEKKTETPSKTSSLFQTPVTPDIPKIKEEPQSDSGTGSSLLNVPEAPLPPDTTSKTSYAAGESSTSSIEPELPLPPDFAPAKIPHADTTPTPPSPATNKPKFDPSLLPPMDVPGDSEGDESDIQGKGDNESEGDQSYVSEEGSGEDVAKDISPTSESQQTPGFTPQSSFGGANRNTGDSLFTKISRPAAASTSRPLFGEINGHAAPALPPPKTFTSPRSPSPIRTAIPGRLLRPDNSRSVSAPGVASQLLGNRSNAAKPVDTFALSLEQRKAEQLRQAEAQARKEAEETRALLDEEDERLQAYLEAEIKATKKLDEFIAHHDYVGEADKDSIPAQVEAVYRDINSMIDTLGVNSRSLKSFIKGHTELYKDAGRTKDDLEGDEDWCLVEIENLSNIIESDLTRDLEQGGVKDVAGKLDICAEMEKDLVRLRAKHEDIVLIIAAQNDPERLEAGRSLPLNPEQFAQQHEIRRQYAKFQKLLTDAESDLVMLRAKLASQIKATGKSSASPTVEALVRTIKKMTNMAEKRSGDIDVLENQMRRLGFSSGGNREESPFATPAKPSAARTPGTSSTYGLFYTPDSIRSTPRGFNASLTSSTRSYTRSTPPRKKLNGFSEDDKMRLKEHASRRKVVMDKLRSAIEKNGTKVRPMEDA